MIANAEKETFPGVFASHDAMRSYKCFATASQY